MGTTGTFTPAKLIMGVIAVREYSPSDIIEIVEPLYGGTDFISEPTPFDFTDYYTPEMGRNLYRCFISFRELVSPDSLADFKLRSNRAEEHFRVNGRRRVNLDPGILSLHSLILASTKDHSHRIPLSGGIYAEVTLIYEKGRYRDLPWTYPDYRTDEYKAYFMKIRNLLREQLKQKP